ncbi:hypothetical protein GCM10022243_29090 [Saccharothrix violaceirubra]
MGQYVDPLAGPPLGGTRELLPSGTDESTWDGDVTSRDGGHRDFRPIGYGTVVPRVTGPSYLHMAA